MGEYCVPLEITNGDYYSAGWGVDHPVLRVVEEINRWKVGQHTKEPWWRIDCPQQRPKRELIPIDTHALLRELQMEARAVKQCTHEHRNNNFEIAKISQYALYNMMVLMYVYKKLHGWAGICVLMINRSSVKPNFIHVLTVNVLVPTKFRRWSWQIRCRRRRL